jgi:phosphate transport system permease protein
MHKIKIATQTIAKPDGTLLQQRSRFHALFGTAMTVLAIACTITTLTPLFAVLVYVSVQGVRRLNLDLFTQLPPPPGIPGGGIANAIIGTLIVVGIASLISVPFGVLAGIYLAEFSAGSRLARWLRLATNVLSGVPSIVAGVFAYGLLVVTGICGFSAIAGGVALSVIMLPTIVRTTDEALQLIPQDIRWASAGIGASRSQMVLNVILPAALPGVVTGILLAIARAAGETAPLLFTALNSSLWFTELFDPTPTLSVSIYNFALAPFKEQQELAWAGSLILMLLVLVTSILARWATRRKVD